MDKSTFIDKSGVEYQLVEQVYNQGDPACVGCAFKFGNGEACKSAPTCTPKLGDHKTGYTPMFKYPTVWKVKSYVYNI